MQKIVCVKENYIDAVNQDLSNGWSVKMITPYNQPVSRGEGYTSDYGVYGAYIVLEKEEK